MDLGLREKTVLVFGAAGGLGSSIATALALEGAKIALADIATDSLATVSADLKSVGAHVLPLNWDIADLSVIDSKFQEIERELGPVDVLINNTGGPPPTTAAGQDPELWLNYFRSMVQPVIAITDRALPAMRARQWGRIITSTSSGIISPIPNLAISNALRLSLVGWSKTLSREVAADGVTVNVVVPGRIATGRITALDEKKASRDGRSVKQVEADSVASIPIGRYGRPEEYANVVAFLAGDKASYLTGSIFRVDGGLISSI